MADSAFAVLGGGCFWCLEAAFQRLPGVLHVDSGYAGGSRPDPSYQQVCSGLTGHAEVVRVEFNPAALTYAEILDYFFALHDPTTEDRQGADIGSQYRSIILYANEEQQAQARRTLQDQAANFSSPLVTELEPLTDFWPAEAEHQDFYQRNPAYGYCRVVIQPKLEKLKKILHTKIALT